MLRVLTLSTLFPDASRPTFGIFVERQTRELAARTGVELQVVAPIGIPPGFSRHPRYRALAALPKHEVRNGLTVHRPRFAALPGPLACLNPASLAHALLPLLEAIRRDFRFDVIDAEFFFPDGPAAHRLARALGVGLSIKARGADINFWPHRLGCRGQIVAAGRAAGGMLAVSAALRDEMAALGLPRERIRVHHTGVDQERFHPIDRTAARRSLGLPDGPLLVSVGHLIPRKGHGIAIDAVARVPGATLLVAGEGPLRPELEARIARARLGDRVRLLGSLPHDTLPPLLSAADALVLPAESEGLANVWVEALACGTPVITTDVGGAREAIDRPAAGRLVPRTPAAFADAIRALIAIPPDRAATRAAAERFTWAANADALHAHLAGIARTSI